MKKNVVGVFAVVVFGAFACGYYFLQSKQENQDAIFEQEKNEIDDVQNNSGAFDPLESLSGEAKELYQFLSNRSLDAELVRASTCSGEWYFTLGEDQYLLVGATLYSITNPTNDYDYLSTLRSELIDYQSCLEYSVNEMEAGRTGNAVFISDQEIKQINELLR